MESATSTLAHTATIVQAVHDGHGQAFVQVLDGPKITTYTAIGAYDDLDIGGDVVTVLVHLTYAGIEEVVVWREHEVAVLGRGESHGR